MKTSLFPISALRCKGFGIRLITMITCCAGSAIAAPLPLGTVTFGNNSGSLVLHPATGNPVADADQVRAALYWSPAGSNDFVQIGDSVAVGVPVPGVFAGGTRSTGPETPGGTAAQFKVRAWSGGFATYEAALQFGGVLVGESAVVTVTTGNPAGDPPIAPVSLVSGGLQRFTLTTNTGSLLNLSCVTNKTVECGSAWSFDAPVVTGGCDIPAVSILGTVTNGVCPQVITRTWYATDGCVTNTCTQTVTVEDSTLPTIICAAKKNAQCGQDWSFDTPNVADNCHTVELTIVSTVTNGTCPQVIVRTWAAMDACGNASQCSQRVTLHDTTPPVLTCASNLIVECGQAWEFDSPVATDACGTNDVEIVTTITNGLCPQVITRTWTASDACGNVAQCEQTVTIVDSTVLAICPADKSVSCETNWSFDLPEVTNHCVGEISIVELATVGDQLCPETMTRTWGITNLCNGSSVVCSQRVTVLCTNCDVLVITKACPAYPTPPSGILAFTGTVTNAGNVTLTNVVVVNNQPAENTPVFGPVDLAPGEGAIFAASYEAAGCGPFADTLTVTGTSVNGVAYTNSSSTVCPGTTEFAPGDRNGDGIVDQGELDAVLAFYWPNSPWLYMTNAALLCNGIFQFGLTNLNGWNFTVLVSTNFTDWTNLPSPARPVYQFVDPAATNSPERYYRLQWP